MKSAATKTTAFVATAAAIGFTSLFGAVSPANAAVAACTNGGTLLSGNVCELRLESSVSTHTFTPSPQVSKLEALLVGGGGSSGDGGNGGYGAGGGGEVRVVGFADSSTPVAVTVGAPGTASTVSQGAVSSMATAGQAGSSAGVGGASGSSHGPWVPAGGGTNGGGGGGAGASPVDASAGGAGVTVDSVAPAGSLFSGVTDCYGGGGAFLGGAASCGGGYLNSGNPVAPVQNSGGGAAGHATGYRAGAHGLVVLRWLALDDVTVTFNTGGHGTLPAQTLAPGGTITVPTPSALGFDFAGWFADPELTVPATVLAPITASTTYYAKWTAIPPVTVTFATNGHGGSDVAQAVVPGMTATPPALSELGYVFDGWFTDAALTAPANFATAITAATTFYAKWSAAAPVTVTFDTNGHGGSSTSQSVVPGQTATPPVLSEPGYVFDGWFTDAALTVPVDFSAPVSASTTFYAKWSAVAPATVTVSFNGNGHGASVAPVTVAVGATVAKPADPTATGFVFGGWFTDAALTVPVDFSAPVSASTTFYAKWSAVVKPTPTPTPTPSVTPIPPKAEGPLATTGAVIDPSVASLALAALGMGAGLLAVRARRARKTD